MTSPVHGGVLAARALRDAGVQTIFGLPGGHILPLFDGARLEGLRLIDTRHEAGAAFMAEGWALATAGPGVVAVTAGPGLTNAVPGIAEANAAGVPVVVVAGRTALRQRHRGAVQDLDQLELVAPVTKWRAACTQTERIPEYVTEAVHRCRAGSPGVSYLEIPQDVFTAEATAPQIPWPVGHRDNGPSAVPPSLDRALEVLQESERPVVVAGSGAFFSRAADSLTAFAEATSIPITTTSAARGLIDDDHPMCLGGLVHGGVALASADVALVLGSRFNANLLYGGPPLFPPGHRAIQVDIRPENLGGRRRADVELVGDVGATLEGLTEGWSKAPETYREWTAQAREAAAASRESWDAEADRPAKGVHPGWLAREVAMFADEHSPSTFISDGGDSVLWGIAFSRAHRPGTNLFIGSAMGTLGVGLPFGIASRAARPDEPVFVFTGDGAFGLSAMEVDTAARHRLPVLIVVVNNGGWGDVRHEQRMWYGDEADQGAILSNMRYDLLAEAVGGHGERVTEQDQVRPALERALKATEEGVPAVVDVVTDPAVISDLMRNLSSLSLM
ncbi:MAG TPA: thiamine pyrophosphate-binding protein [Actinomycetota bacterium]|nr:thiamine pyrophosphate-binding protein [Actinomycetota bacterium]